jgi:actin-related protein
MESINAIPEDIRYYFLENIIVSGGNTKFANFEKRLIGEVRENSPESVENNFTFYKYYFSI